MAARVWPSDWPPWPSACRTPVALGMSRVSYPSLWLASAAGLSVLYAPGRGVTLGNWHPLPLLSFFSFGATFDLSANVFGFIAALPYSGTIVADVQRRGLVSGSLASQTPQTRLAVLRDVESFLRLNRGESRLAIPHLLIPHREGAAGRGQES